MSFKTITKNKPIVQNLNFQSKPNLSFKTKTKVRQKINNVYTNLLYLIYY